MDKEKLLEILRKPRSKKGSYDFIFSLHRDYVMDNKFQVFFLFLINNYGLNESESNELLAKKVMIYRAYTNFKKQRQDQYGKARGLKKGSDILTDAFTPEILDAEVLKKQSKPKSYIKH